MTTATALGVSPHWLIVRAAKNRRNPGQHSAWTNTDGRAAAAPAAMLAWALGCSYQPMAIADAAFFLDELSLIMTGIGQQR